MRQIAKVVGSLIGQFFMKVTCQRFVHTLRPDGNVGAYFALGRNAIVSLISHAGRASLYAWIACLVMGAYPSDSKEAVAGTDEVPKPRVDCAITFDDGPGHSTEKLLDILKKKQVVATFFVLGEFVQREPQVVLRIAADGHEVDNHSFDHPNLRRLDFRSQKAEIEKTELALLKLGITPKYFRPPYGSYNADTVRAAAANGLVLALWTVDALDWKYHAVHSLVARFEQGIEGRIGGIYLFHDPHSWTVAAIPDILDDLERNGCRFVTLGEYMNNRESKSSTDVSPPARDGDPEFEDRSAGER